MRRSLIAGDTDVSNEWRLSRISEKCDLREKLERASREVLLWIGTLKRCSAISPIRRLTSKERRPFFLKGGFSHDISWTKCAAETMTQTCNKHVKQNGNEKKTWRQIFLSPLLDKHTDIPSCKDVRTHSNWKYVWISTVRHYQVQTSSGLPHSDDTPERAQQTSKEKKSAGETKEQNGKNHENPLPNPQTKRLDDIEGS